MFLQYLLLCFVSFSASLPSNHGNHSQHREVEPINPLHHLKFKETHNERRAISKTIPISEFNQHISTPSPTPPSKSSSSSSSPSLDTRTLTAANVSIDNSTLSTREVEAFQHTNLFIVLYNNPNCGPIGSHPIHDVEYGLNNNFSPWVAYGLSRDLYDGEQLDISKRIDDPGPDQKPVPAKGNSEPMIEMRSTRDGVGGGGGGGGNGNGRGIGIEKRKKKKKGGDDSPGSTDEDCAKFVLSGDNTSKWGQAADHACHILHEEARCFRLWHH